MYLGRSMERVNGERGYSFLVGKDVTPDGEQRTSFGCIDGRLSPNWDGGD